MPPRKDPKRRGAAAAEPQSPPQSFVTTRRGRTSPHPKLSLSPPPKTSPQNPLPKCVLRSAVGPNGKPQKHVGPKGGGDSPCAIEGHYDGEGNKIRGEDGPVAELPLDRQDFETIVALSISSNQTFNPGLPVLGPFIATVDTGASITYISRKLLWEMFDNNSDAVEEYVNRKYVKKRVTRVVMANGTSEDALLIHLWVREESTNRSVFIEVGISDDDGSPLLGHNWLVAANVDLV